MGAHSDQFGPYERERAILCNCRWHRDLHGGPCAQAAWSSLEGMCGDCLLTCAMFGGRIDSAYDAYVAMLQPEPCGGCDTCRPGSPEAAPEPLDEKVVLAAVELFVEADSKAAHVWADAQRASDESARRYRERQEKEGTR